jgi:hypothetical protein
MAEISGHHAFLLDQQKAVRPDLVLPHQKDVHAQVLTRAQEVCAEASGQACHHLQTGFRNMCEGCMHRLFPAPSSTMQVALPNVEM